MIATLPIIIGKTCKTSPSGDPQDVQHQIYPPKVLKVHWTTRGFTYIWQNEWQIIWCLRNSAVGLRFFWVQDHHRLSFCSFVQLRLCWKL